MRTSPITCDLPDGWTVMPAGPNHAWISSGRGGVTVDFRARVFRAGCDVKGDHLSARTYAGPGWRWALYMDAISWLRRAHPLPGVTA